MPISLDGSGSISGISTFSFSDEIIHTGDTNTAIKFPANDTITFETGGSERLRLDSNGIRTPDDIFINVRGKGFKTSDWIITNTTSGNALSFSGGASSGEKLRIDGGGGLQLGTSTATASKLTVYGANDAAAIFQGSGTGTGAGNGLLVGNNGGTTGLLWNYENGNTLFATNNVERLRITSGGVKQIKNGNLNISSTYIDFSGSISTPSTAAAIYRPADNTLAFSTLNAERARIDSGGDFGVGLTNPTAKLHAQDDSATETTILKLRNYASSVNTKPSMSFEASTSSGQGATSTIQGLAGTDAGGSNSQNDSGMKFIVRHGGSGTEREAFSIKTDGNIHFPNGQGIDFSATSDSSGTMSSELLDDYEEGLWIPLIRNTSGSGTYGSSNVGSYTKIGNMVHISGTIHWTAMSGTTNWAGVIRNLPFASYSGTGYYRSACVVGATSGLTPNNSGDPNIVFIMDRAQGFLYIVGINASSGGFTHYPTISNAGSVYGFDLSYRVS